MLPTLFFSFDRRLSTGKVTDYVYDLHKAALTVARKYGHEIVFYGDSTTLKALKGYFDHGISVDSQKFSLVDDLKVYIHQNNSLDCITVDGDLILQEPLRSYDYGDVWFEHIELNIQRPPYRVTYHPVLNEFRKEGAESKLKHLDLNFDGAVNIGIIKFNSQFIKDYLIDSYYKSREFYLNNIYPRYDMKAHGHVPSVVVSQFYWTCILDDLNADCKYYTNYANYDHFLGPLKWLDSTHDLVEKILFGEKGFI